VAAFSFKQAGRIAAGAVSFLAWSTGCAIGTHPGETSTDPLTSGETAGTGGTGGADLGGTGGTSSAGSMSEPVAGMPAGGSVGVAGASDGGAGGSLSVAGSGGVGGTGGAGGTAGMGGAGGTGGMAGMAGTGGAPPVGFRYAKLVATSEQAGKVWSSVAELQILTTGNTPISRTGWTVTADSQETDDEQDPATNAIDGDNATFWHTEWEPAPADVNDAKLPHSLIVDMKSAHTVTGFSYLPRQERANGRIKDYEFYVSKDGTTWGTAVKTGAFPDVITLQTVVF
jgi:large repetitive protein